KGSLIKGQNNPPSPNGAKRYTSPHYKTKKGLVPSTIGRNSLAATFCCRLLHHVLQYKQSLIGVAAHNFIFYTSI
ncbi:hypothetical protein PanWU01x14_136870, partial [Parasponia andersonii]